MNTRRLFVAFVTMLLPIMVDAEVLKIGGLYYELNTDFTAVLSYKTETYVIGDNADGTDYGTRYYYNCYYGNLTIPSLITYRGEEYTVTSIGDEAFRDCTGLTSVIIPNSVTSIGNLAFCGCSGLASVTIPNSVTSIGNSTFSGCSGLTSVTIPNSVTSIGDGGFSGCSGLTSVTIPNSVTSIGDGGFSGCSGLTSIKVEKGNAVYNSRENCNAIIKTAENKLILGCKNTVIPNSVTSIGNSAFSGCSGLTSVTIPNTVTSIGGFAFYGCSGLTSVTIPNGVTSIGSYAFSGCSGLTSMAIPNSVTSIGNSAFSGCSGLTSVTIPNSVTSISDGAFSKCSGLTSVTIPNSVTSIGNSAFSGCSGLTSVTIPNSVTSIGSIAFERCSGLTSVTIPNTVTSIAMFTFYGCSGLTSMTIPNSVTSIGNEAFSGCTSLTSVTIPNSILSIGFEAFFDCKSLTSVYLSNIETWCKIDFKTEAAYSRKKDCTSNPLTYAHRLFVNDEELKDLVIPNGVEIIRNQLFKGCSSITSVTIPQSVTSIGDGAFSGCSELTSVTLCCNATLDQSVFDGCKLSDIIFDSEVVSNKYYDLIKTNNIASIVIGNNAKTIEEETFSSLKDIKTITIGSSVETIKTRAFANMDNLESVKCKAVKVPDTHRTTFENSYIDYVALIVSEESAEDYRSTAPWSGFKSISGTSMALYTLTYMVDGEVYKTQTYEEGDVVNPEPAPIKEGYVFSGWENLPSIMPGEDITVSGTFTEIPPEKCSAPTINLVKGEIVFACETDGVSYHYDIMSLDDKDGEGNNIRLTNTYRVSVYASKEGYSDSDVTTQDVRVASNADANSDGVINAADIVAIVNLIIASQ